MKEILFVAFCLSVGIFSTNAHAFIIDDVTYTGQKVERIDSCGYGCGHVSGAFSSDLSFDGGPVANNSVGFAQQFNVAQETHIDYLLASAHISGDQLQDGLIASNRFYFKLYTGTLTTYGGNPSQPYPDSTSAEEIVPMFVQTSTYDVFFPELGLTHTFNQDGNYIDIPLPFDITLDPGTYWIAQERYPEDTAGLFPYVPNGDNHNFVDSISVKFATTPEPSTIALFGLGIMLLLGRTLFLRHRTRTSTN